MWLYTCVQYTLVGYIHDANWLKYSHEDGCASLCTRVMYCLQLYVLTVCAILTVCMCMCNLSICKSVLSPADTAISCLSADVII